MYQVVRPETIRGQFIHHALTSVLSLNVSSLSRLLTLIVWSVGGVLCALAECVKRIR